MRVKFLLCRLGLVVASVVAFAGLTSRAAAQTSTGSIRGYVTDSAGTPIEGARVVAVSVLSGAQREVPTQSRGYYAFLGLVPGEYDVTARQIGMAPQKIRARVLVGGVYPLDFKLAANAIQLEAVTVAVANGVETRTSEVATNVTPQQMEQLPTVSRNFLDLAALAPGVIIPPDRVMQQPGQLSARTFSAGAQGPSEINVFIDGASLKNDLTAGGIAGQDASRGNPFPRNAIQEYRVITQNFKAEYQNASSAIITATTKSGGNTWSGDASFGYQNKDLVAIDTFAVGHTKPDYTRYLVSFDVGGPLIKDRLRFFGSYEGNYQNRALAVNIPTAPTGFAALDSISWSKFNGDFTSPFRETLLFGKLSYTPNEHSTADLSFNNRDETDTRDFGSLLARTSAVHYLNKVSLGTLKYNYFTGPWLNEANVTYERFLRNPSPDSVGAPHRWYAFPTTCCVEIGSNLSSQNFTQKRLGFRDDVTYTGFHSGGDHVMKAGINVDFLTFDVNKQNNSTPEFFFADGVNCNPACTGNESYGYRVPYQLHWGTGDPFLNDHNTQFGVYVQDDWSPSSRLTLNLGIRWDFESNMLNYDYVTPQIVRDTLGRYNSTLLFPIDTAEYFTNGSQRKKPYGAFQPRFGFSYALDRESKTTLFGGFGIFYDRSYFDVAVDQKLRQSFPQYTIYFANPDSAAAGHIAPGQIAWNNSYLTTDKTVLNSLVSNGQVAAQEIWLIGNNTKLPRSNQWNVGLRRLFGNVLVSAAYVGVRSYDGLVFNWANITLNPANGNCCVGGNLGHGFSNVVYTTNSVKTWYDALQIQVTRPYQRTGSFGWGGGLTLTYGTRSVQGVDNPDDEFAFTQANLIGKHPTNDEKTRVVANWTTDVPYAYGVQFSGLLTLGSGQLIDVGNNRPGGNFIPGGFSPPKYGFIVPSAFRYRELDLRLRKDFPSISGTTVGITADLFNVFNYQNFSTWNTGNGQPTALASDPRRFQIGAEYHF